MRHTMQIIRYMNLNRGEFSMESYITISGALARFIIKENKIMNEMQQMLPLRQIFRDMLSHQKTRR